MERSQEQLPAAALLDVLGGIKYYHNHVRETMEINVIRTANACQDIAI
jgi:hypothetical protein